MTAGRLAAPLATSALFAGSFVAAKWASFELGPLSATLLRYTVALAFLLLLAWFRDPTAITAPTKQDVPAMIALGLFGVVGYHWFFFVALRHTEVANTAIINASSPVVTGLAAAGRPR